MEIKSIANKNVTLKTITNADAINFPVVEPYVGQLIEGKEWYKAISGEEFTLHTEEAPKVEAEETEEAPKKSKK